MAAPPQDSSFETVLASGLDTDPHPKQPAYARVIKSTGLWKTLQRSRLFGLGNHVVARKR
jgi:hypothetical protein